MWLVVWGLDHRNRPHANKGIYIEQLTGVWPKIIPVAMEMPICYVNFSSLNYPNLSDESLGPYG